VTIFLAEFLVPPALDRTEKLMEERFKVMDQTWRFYRKHNWFQGIGNRIFRVPSASPNGEVLKGVTLLEMDSDFHVISREDFNQVIWQNEKWEAGISTKRRFLGGEMLSFETTRNPTLSWTERPGRFENLRGRPKQKSLAQLAATIDALEHRGLSATRYRLEYHNRFAYPLLALGMVLLALPWLCAPRRRRTLAGALIEATGLIFGAYFLVMMASAAVTGGACSAALGVWLPVAAVMAMALLGWMVLVKRGRLGKP
jgi:lipopolysaccharide export LptBFGC system permease protein LptF